MKLRNLIFILVNLNIISTYADVELKDQYSFAVGMVNLALNQNPDAFDANKNISSGTVSNISLDVNYEHFTTDSASHAVKVQASGFAGETTKYYSIGYNHRYYFGSVGTIKQTSDELLKIYAAPIFRYYAGFLINAVSIVYETNTEVRSDLLLEAGANAGVLYNTSRNNAYKLEVSLLRGTGVETSGTGIQFFFGTSFFVDSII
jgi:hypothetical protein